MTFRQHLTTLVAVFVALAVGIVLGGGLLSDVTDAAPAEVDATAGEAEPQAAYTASCTGAVAPVGSISVCNTPLVSFTIRSVS